MRRAIALVVLPALLAASGLALYLPAKHWYDTQQRWRVDTKQLLAQAAQSPAVQVALEKELDGMRQSVLWTKFYTAGGAMSAAAALQADIRTLFSDMLTGGHLLTPIAAEESSMFVRHGVRLTASFRVHQLQEVLNAIAQHPRFLHVGRLTVVAPQAQSADENPALAITMDVYGYELLSDERAPAPVTVASSRQRWP
jgi:hypothetical protein